MDDKVKSKLAAKLSGDKKFDKAYTQENRRWFARAAVEAAAAVKPDPQVEAETQRIITAANARVAADRDFKTSVTLTSAEASLERKDIARRVEIIYGLIAQKPDLAETSQDALRRFLARRRYRSTVRLVYHINPNTNGYFVYPDDCNQLPPPGRADWRTNIDTKDLWQRTGVDQVPLRVKPPPGGGPADPRTASEKLWIAHTNPCECNLFDCAHAICCVLMDSLSEAVDPDKLYKAVHGRRADNFLIVHPNRFSGTHFLWELDTEPKKVFSKEKVAPADLQVGDHVFIWNHGLYPQLLPFGFWTGEHAVVTSCGDRKFNSGRGFLFSGHGLDKPETVEDLHDRLAKEIQMLQHRIYAIATIFMAYRKSGDTSIPAARVHKELIKFTQPDGTQVDVLAYEIVAEVKFIDYRARAPRGGSPPMVKQGGFVAFDIPSMNIIGLARPGIDTIADQKRIGINNVTPLVRTGAPAPGGSVYEPPLWQIRYQDSDTGTDQDFPLFGGPKGALRLLDRKDMPKFKFGRLLATDTGALVTRPTADNSPTYLSFLRTSGAIT